MSPTHCRKKYFWGHFRSSSARGSRLRPSRRGTDETLSLVDAVRVIWDRLGGTAFGAVRVGAAGCKAAADSDADVFCVAAGECARKERQGESRPGNDNRKTSHYSPN